MSEIFTVESYFPDRSPTWGEALVVVSGLIVLAFSLPSSSLPAAALGFVGTTVLIGPFSQTRVGKRIDEWGTEISSLQKAAVIVLFAIGTLVAFSFEVTPTEFISSLGLGMVAFGVLGIAAHLLRERRIEGWFPESS